MNNAEIAKIFHEIGEILELQGENQFRVRAYHQGAKTIEFFPEPLSQVYKKQGRDGLMAIPGVGEALADKVIELLETNRLYFYEKLIKKVPAVILEVATIPGVGPKTAQKIVTVFKPKNLTDLKTKLEKLKPNTKGEREYQDFQEKTIANLLQGMEILSRRTGRLVLTEALPVAEKFLARLQTRPEAKEVDPVGSLRRKRETVGDIDIIAASAKPEKLIETFVTTDGVTQVLAKGETKAMIVYGGHIDVDLEILPPAEYGSLLQHFTGSKEHNIAMRSLTDDLGLSFSEHGFKVTKPTHTWAKKQIELAKKAKCWDERRQMILCAKEEDVYATIGLAWIPPELRENSGELEAAKAGKLPKLVEIGDMHGDIHVHSNRSGDGREEPEALIERAIELGYAYLGITDHTQGLGVAGKLSNKQFAKHVQYLQKLNDRYQEIRVLAGCELNIMADGTLDVPDDLLAEMDVVVASVHSAFRQDKDMMTDRILRAFDNPHIDILAHPTTRILGYREEITVDWERVFERAAATRTALEINAYPERLDLDGLRIRQAKDVGCKFVISTDAHQLAHLDNLRFGVAMARRGWCEASDVLNTLEVERFGEWLKRKKLSD